MQRREDPQKKAAAQVAEQEAGQEEQEDESQRQCLVCGEIPDSIICLACNHSVDIPCAAKIILQAQQFKDIDLSQIKCLICGEVTHLSEEVQSTLLKYLESDEVEFDMGEEQMEEGGEEDRGEEGNEEEADEGAEEEGDDAEEAEEEKPEEVVKRNGKVSASNSSIGKGKTGSQQKSQKKTQQQQNNNRQAVGSSINPNDLSFHFACIDHPNEEYAYYSASTRKLYCAQCLLSEKYAPEVKDLKSIKRSLQTIMQHFQELMSSVEVNKGLLTNRKKDAEIKLEEMRSRMNARRATAEAMFEEIVERTIIFKNQFLDMIEAKSEAASTELKNSMEMFDEKLEYLDAVMDQIAQIEQSETCDEDLVGFFFANQEKIRSFIEEDNEQKLMLKLRNACEQIDLKHKQLVDSELQRNKEELENAIRSVFAPKQPLQGTKGRVKTDDAEQAVDRLKPLSKYSLPEGFGNQAIRQTAETKEKRSGSNSKLSSAILQQNSNNGSTPTFAHNFASSLKSASKIRANLGPSTPAPIYPPSTLQSTPGKAAIMSTLDKFHQQMAVKFDTHKPAPVLPSSKRCPHETLEDPLTSIQKKLAIFDIKSVVANNRASPLNHHNHTHMPKDWIYSKEGASRDTKDALIQGLVDIKHTNVENLRTFRQKMREKYNKEQMTSSNAARTRSIYSTH